MSASAVTEITETAIPTVTNPALPIAMPAVAQSVQAVVPAASVSAPPTAPAVQGAIAASPIPAQPHVKKGPFAIEKIYIGAWFQRTTLHLTEIYEFLQNKASALELEEERLQAFHAAMDIDTVRLEPGRLDVIKVKTKTGIEIKFYEDGLVILDKPWQKGIPNDVPILTSYYEKKLSPAIDYIFSLGAPIPKELTSIMKTYPFFVTVKNADDKDIAGVFDRLNEKKLSEIKRPEFEIHRGRRLFLVSNISELPQNIEYFIEEQIFLGEVRAQLEHYLNLHRVIWERITEIKDRGDIRGKDAVKIKERIAGYTKTMNLIEARLNQMDPYLRTRGAGIRANPGLAKFVPILDAKHDMLVNTLGYVRSIWGMTKTYVQSAADIFNNIARSTENSVRNLAIITSMGVGATVLGLFNQAAPRFSTRGFIYFLLLACIGYSADKLMKLISWYRKYEIVEIKAAKDIQ